MRLRELRALVAEWQHRHAGDPGIARAMAAIAADERRHAALAWRVARWARSRLDAGACRRRDAARADAVEALTRDVVSPAPREWVDVAGIPDADDARALALALREGLWS